MTVRIFKLLRPMATSSLAKRRTLELEVTFYLFVELKFNKKLSAPLFIEELSRSD